MDAVKTKKSPLTTKSGAAALVRGMWKGIVGMPTDKLTQVGNFISRVGFPAFLILFAMWYFVPIINRVADGHLEYLRETAKTSAETRADLGRLVDATTASNSATTETNRILQETSREHSLLLHRIDDTLKTHAVNLAAPPAESPTP